MNHNRSSKGFIELTLLILGISGAIAWGFLHKTPAFVSSQFSLHKVAVTVRPTPVIDHIQVEETIALAITDTMQLRTETPPQIIPLIGIQAPATPSAICDLDVSNREVSKKIFRKKIYLVRYDSTDASSSARYAFLEDGTLLNKDLITNGLAVLRDEPHIYHDEFAREEQKSAEHDTGIWAPACLITPTPSAPTSTPTHPATWYGTETPSMTPRPTQTPTQVPTYISTPIPTQKPTASPTPTPPPLQNYLTPTSSISRPQSLNADIILQLINLHRKSMGLAAFEKDSALCSLAEERAPQLQQEIFGDSTVHEGLYSRNIPYWITENMASYPTEELVVNWWLGSTIHRSAIEGNYRYSCGACYATSCTQLFTSYVKK